MSNWRRSGECVQRRVRFVNIQSSLHFCLCVYVQCRVWYIYHVEFHFRLLDTCYHFWLNISCGVVVMVRSHKKNIR